MYYFNVKHIYTHTPILKAAKKKNSNEFDMGEKKGSLFIKHTLTRTQVQMGKEKSRKKIEILFLRILSVITDKIQFNLHNFTM